MRSLCSAEPSCTPCPLPLPPYTTACGASQDEIHLQTSRFNRHILHLKSHRESTTLRRLTTIQVYNGKDHFKMLANGVSAMPAKFSVHYSCFKIVLVKDKWVLGVRVRETDNPKPVKLFDCISIGVG